MSANIILEMQISFLIFNELKMGWYIKNVTLCERLLLKNHKLAGIYIFCLVLKFGGDSLH